MLHISATLEWCEVHPGAAIGLLELADVECAGLAPRLEARKREVEARLRAEYAGFTRADFLALPVMAGYERYYRRFDKTYHVLLQVESIVLRDKSLPDVLPPVDACFTAEVDTLTLTAAHDVDMLEAPVWIDTSREGETMTLMNGVTKPIRGGDMVMRDRRGICCSILYGQDNISPVSAVTRQVLYVTYAPAGVPVEIVEAQVNQIEENVRLFAPRVQVVQRGVIRG